MPVDPTLFRQVMSQFATGITVVTTRAGQEINGLTINAFCSVSLEPPLLLVCIQKNTYNHDLILRSRFFAVNILHQAQEEIARRFATRSLSGADRFAEIAYRSEISGAPIFADAQGWLDCQLVATYPGGDHTIFLGQVLALDCRSDVQPLLFFRKQYHHTNGAPA